MKKTSNKLVKTKDIVLAIVIVFAILVTTIAFTAIFKNDPNYFKVRYYDTSGELILEVRVKEGEEAPYPNEKPIKEGDSYIYYVFEHWLNGNSYYAINATELLKHVRSNLDVYPYFTQHYYEYEVNFYEEDKSTLIETNIAKGYGQCESPTEKTVDRSDGDFYYNFEGWAEIQTGNIIDLRGIKENVNLYPVFKKIRLFEHLDGIYYEYNPSYNGYEVVDADSTMTLAHIPSSVNDTEVTSISNDAFDDCISLTSVKIPKTVTYIGSSPFTSYVRSSLITSIVVDEGNKVYDSRDNCNAIIHTPNNELILGCRNTTIPDDVLSIGMGAFEGNNSITNITIPDSVVFIKDHAFRNCDSLKNISLPNVTSIGIYAFSGCSSLTAIEIPKIILIGTHAFAECSLLKSIEIPNVTTIKSYTFYGCSSLESISLPKVTSIEEAAFAVCASLISIEMPKAIYIDSLAFNGCSFTSILLPKDLTYIGDAIFLTCEDLEKVYYKGDSLDWSNVEIDGYFDSSILYFYIENIEDVPNEGNYWHYDEDGITPIVWTINP